MSREWIPRRVKAAAATALQDLFGTSSYATYGRWHTCPCHDNGMAPRLAADGLLAEGELAALERSAWQDVDWAVDGAERGDWEPLEHLERDVHTPAA